jgi:hypothetical protein
LSRYQVTEGERQYVHLNRLTIEPNHYAVIESCHNTDVGHHGVALTCERVMRVLQQRGEEPWPQFNELIRQFCRSCVLCQKMQPLKGLIQTHKFTVSTYEPMEQLNIDFIGPLTQDMYEHKYILVVIQ